MGKTLALHSYKGGTGKTTLISNLAAIYAKKELNVCLLDFDLYAPSLCTYFNKKPKYYINDFLAGNVDLSDVVVDLSNELNLKGKFFLGFSSSKIEDIHEIEIHHEMKWQLTALKRFLAAKEELFSNFNLDYILLDTSPGIRYWSINAIASAELLFLILKLSDMDIEGTKKMIEETYNTLIRFGSKKFIILNKTPGASPIKEFMNSSGKGTLLSDDLEKDLQTSVMATIPCYCDVQFSRHEYLSTIKQPNHPFSKKVNSLAEQILKL